MDGSAHIVGCAHDVVGRLYVVTFLGSGACFLSPISLFPGDWIAISFNDVVINGIRCSTTSFVSIFGNGGEDAVLSQIL